ncbi:MAG: CBS domain-containing protein [Pirellulales bacterium]
MKTCPQCGYDRVIEGADNCDKCGASLSHLTKPRGKSAIERSIHKERIHVLGPKAPLVVSPDATVAEVLKLLVAKSVGCVIVVEQEKVVGIFSERDVLFRLGDQAQALGGEPIRKYMTKGPETLDLDDKIAFAVHKMDLGGYRHVPIMRDGKVVGVISARDILGYLTHSVLNSEA